MRGYWKFIFQVLSVNAERVQKSLKFKEISLLIIIYNNTVLRK